MNNRILVPIAVWILVQGCGSSQSSTLAAGETNCVGPDCHSGKQSKNDYEMSLGSAGVGNTATVDVGGAASPAVTLCGVKSPLCDPDDAASCQMVSPPAAAGSAGTSAVPSSVAAAGRTEFGVSTAGNAGARINFDDALAAGPIAMAGAAGDRSFACHVRKDAQSIHMACENAGQGTLGFPCFGQNNCAAGFACVEENGTAQCRPYCCHGASSCPANTYCDQRLTRELDLNLEPVAVPVCMPGADCKFDDPYPCPPDRTCSCPAGKACAVVRADGTTACAVPGSGKEGERCPCAAGHVCADTRGTCLKVCSLESKGSTCGDEVCQGSESMPKGWGVCVGPTAFQ